MPPPEDRCHQFGYQYRTRYDVALALRQSQFRKLKPGLSLAQIGRKLNISPHSAHRWARKFGYPLRRAFYKAADGRPLHEVMAEKFRKLPLGLTKRQLMKRLGRSERNGEVLVQEIRIHTGEKETLIPR